MVSNFISVLVIDDNEDNLVALKALIRDVLDNTVVYTALDGEKGLAAAYEIDPDVILLDIAMPGIDGFEVCRRLKSDNTMKDIPIIFLTAVKSDKKSRITALQCGAEAFLAKPIDESELIAQIRAMVKIKAANVEKRNETKRLASLVEERTKELKVSEERYKSLYEHSGVGIGYYSPDGKILSYNKKALEYLGGKLENYLGKSLYEVFAKQVAEMKMDLINKTLASNGPFEYEGCMNMGSGRKYFVIISTKIASSNGETAGVQVALHDITNRKQVENQLLYLSYHDQLTGLYNRRYFEKTLIEIDTEENLPISIIMADVNGLKLINDSFGHATGDRFLLNAAVAIKEICRPGDVAARLGGDEFVLILPKTSLEETMHLVEMMNFKISSDSISKMKLSVSFGYETKTLESQTLLDILSNAENYMYRNKIYEHSSTRSSLVEIIMNTLFEKSSRELLHSKRVSEISENIAHKLGLGTDFVNKIRTAGLLHDIGKIGIDERILNKPAHLDKREWDELRKHPEIGWRILSSTNEFADVAEFILEHHEKWDGSGYPKGLIGEQISLEARIIAIADAYDAMRNARSYQEGKNKEDTIAEIKACAGSHFDPTLVDFFLNQVLDK